MALSNNFRYKIINTNHLDPELEALRNSVQPADNTDDILVEILPKLETIHAAYLFAGVGHMALQKLCQNLSASPSTLYRNGWQAFARELGLDSIIIKVIENNFFHQDPTYHVILTYIQWEKSTMSKIFVALKEIQRHDIISEIYNLFSELAEKIKDSVNDNLDQQLLKPRKIVQAPLVLANLKNIPEEKVVTKKIKYDKVVMLTFAADCIAIAQMVANEFRKKRDKIIGVVILQEHASKVNADRENFIGDCFKQADYIIPILSFGYLNLISSNTSDTFNSAIENLDHTYAKYIHKLISNSYIRNGCLNKNIRCLIPDGLVHSIQKHPAMVNSELRVWVTTSEIEKLAERILSNNF